MILLANGKVITRDPEGIGYLPDGGVVTDGGKIVEVGTTADLKAKYPQAEFVDARGGVIMPGLINAHTHIYSALARGLSIDGYNPTSFYEVLDGQQRTLSVMQYLKHQYPITLDGKKYYWDALPDDSYDAIMNYEFMVYICEGKESEKLEWFRVVNIAGAKLTEQELRNSVYTGAWLSDAKRYFSKRNCAAKLLSDKYITGDPNRQELLEKALRGICEYQGISEITEYMARYKSDADADELWQYFQDVIHWVEKIFPKYFLDMKGLDWCHLYNEYHNFAYNSSVMAAEVKRLHEDEDVQKPKGIYEFLLCRDTDPFAGRLLNLRAFDKRDKLAAYSRQNGICPICGEHFAFEEMEGDHIKPWSKGGQTTPDNCQMLCKACNGKKSDKY